MMLFMDKPNLEDAKENLVDVSLCLKEYAQEALVYL